MTLMYQLHCETQFGAINTSCEMNFYLLTAGSLTIIRR